MANFYDKWLGMWDEQVQERQQARKWIHDDEIEWVSTPQDDKIGLLVSPETGFKTWGSESMVAEIPVGWHTGKHAHGEEGIHIIRGEGFSIINGRKYEWAKGSTLWIPFGAEHQHFNTGFEPARYFSLMSLHLEEFAGLGRVDQLEVCGPTDTPVDAPLAADGIDEQHRRIALTWDDAPKIQGSHQGTEEAHTQDSDGAEQKPHSHHAFYVDFMKPEVGFQNRELEISGILSDAPHSAGGKHAHMEAILFILQGEGYSIVDGEKVPWKEGTCFHVQGPQTMHQHFNESDIPSHMLRCAPGLRMKFFQPIAKEGFPRFRVEKPKLPTDAG